MNSVYSHTECYDLVQWKHTEQNKQRENIHVRKSRENEAHRLLEILFQQSHTGTLTSSSSNLWQKFIRDSVDQRFLLVTGHLGTLCLAYT